MSLDKMFAANTLYKCGVEINISINCSIIIHRLSKFCPLMNVVQTPFASTVILWMEVSWSGVNIWVRVFTKGCGICQHVSALVQITSAVLYQLFTSVQAATPTQNNGNISRQNRWVSLQMVFSVGTYISKL